jgi:hypothetical protein
MAAAGVGGSAGSDLFVRKVTASQAVVYTVTWGSTGAEYYRCVAQPLQRLCTACTAAMNDGRAKAMLPLLTTQHGPWHMLPASAVNACPFVVLHASSYVRHTLCKAHAVHPCRLCLAPGA